jgi:cytoskeletal protein CcmA (bactofilin family)
MSLPLSNMQKILEQIRTQRVEKNHEAANEPAWFVDTRQPIYRSARPSILSRGHHFTGDIERSGAMLIAGRVQGKIKMDVLKISKHGHVKGEIRCKILHVDGIFDGHGICDILTIGPKARVSANIRYKVIRIADGASISGKLNSALRRT